MTEWKAAGYVFSVVALIAIAIELYVNRTQHLSLVYNGCKIDYAYKGEVDTSRDDYHLAQRELGMCLCNAYLMNPNASTGNMIIHLASKYGYPISSDSTHSSAYMRLDSLLKYREDVFNPRMQID